MQEDVYKLLPLADADNGVEVGRGEDHRDHVEKVRRRKREQDAHNRIGGLLFLVALLFLCVGRFSEPPIALLDEKVEHCASNVIVLMRNVTALTL